MGVGVISSVLGGAVSLVSIGKTKKAPAATSRITKSATAAVRIVFEPGMILLLLGGFGGGGVSPLLPGEGAGAGAGAVPDCSGKIRGTESFPDGCPAGSGISVTEGGVAGFSATSHERDCRWECSIGAALRGSGGILTVEGSISGSMEWISSSMGREECAFTTGGAAGGCTGDETAGIRVTGEPQRLQKTDWAGILKPHFEQKIPVRAEDASDGTGAGACGRVETGAVVPGLRTGFIPSIAVSAGGLS